MRAFLFFPSHPLLLLELGLCQFRVPNQGCLIKVVTFGRLLRECWHKNPEFRPSFAEIILQLEIIQERLQQKALVDCCSCIVLWDEFGTLHIMTFFFFICSLFCAGVFAVLSCFILYIVCIFLSAKYSKIIILDVKSLVMSCLVPFGGHQQT